MIENHLLQFTRIEAISIFMQCFNQEICSSPSWMSKLLFYNGDLKESLYRRFRDVGFEKKSSGIARFLGDRLLVGFIKERQRSTAIYKTEADYIAMSGCCAQTPLDEISCQRLWRLFNKDSLYFVDTKVAML
ncbi:hypothetical protein Tco_1264863 [Tanacetum coccineum]